MELLTYNDPIENALECFGKDGFAYGSEIPEKWFMDRFRITPAQTADEHKRNTMIYARYLGHLRVRLLRDKNMALRTKSGFGQEVVQPSEQTQWAMKSFQDEIIKTYEKARDRVSNIAFEKLSDSERRENSDAVAKLSFFANRTVKRLGW
jgi:hypothetical protein